MEIAAVYCNRNKNKSKRHLRKRGNYFTIKLQPHRGVFLTDINVVVVGAVSMGVVVEGNITACSMERAAVYERNLCG